MKEYIRYFLKGMLSLLLVIVIGSLIGGMIILIALLFISNILWMQILGGLISFIIISAFIGWMSKKIDDDLGEL